MADSFSRAVIVGMRSVVEIGPEECGLRGDRTWMKDDQAVVSSIPGVGFAFDDGDLRKAMIIAIETTMAEIR